MNLGILSLIALLLAIVIGFMRNANVGVLCLGFAMILGLSFGIPTGKLLAGFSSSIFMQMVGIIGDFGVMSARMSPLTPESAVVSELMIKQGLSGNTLPLMFSLMLTSIVMAVLVFVYYHGWEVEKVSTEVDRKHRRKPLPLGMGISRQFNLIFLLFNPFV